jgi:DNA polymerase-3 subunit beta
MKFTVDQGELARAAAHVSRILDTTSPAGSALKISVGDGSVTLEGSSPSGFSRSTIPASESESGVSYANAAWLSAAATNGAPGEATWTLDGTRLRFDGTRGRGYVGIMPDALAPEMPAMPASMTALEDGGFAQLVASVSHAVGRDPNNAVLGGIRLHTQDGRLFASATDRYRAAIASIPAEGLECDVIAPGAWLKGAAAGVSSFGVTERAVALSSETDLDVSGVIEGGFPQIDRAFIDPADAELTARADRAMLLDAVRRCRAFDQSSERITKVEFRFADDQMTLSTAASAEEGGFSTSVDADVDGSLPKRLAFNSAYLTDALNADRGEVVTLCAKANGRGGLAPALFASDAGFVRQIVVPLRVD